MMYSTSCPAEQSTTLRKCESECRFVVYEDWINLNYPRVKSEDCLSLRSSEFDCCPEFERYNELEETDCTNNNEYDNEEDDVEIGKASNVLTFEIVNFDKPQNKPAEQNNANIMKKKSSNSRSTSDGNNSCSFTNKGKRRGSETVKELSNLFLNKINQKFYSIRLGEWLKIKAPISSKTPLYLLGKKYIFNNGNYANLMGKKEFMLDFSSRFWFTYRRNFVCLPCPRVTCNNSNNSSNSNINQGSGNVINNNTNSRNGSNSSISQEENNVPTELRTSDCGWGCMLRSGQMILAQAFCLHFLSRNWTIGSESLRDKAFQRQIIKWFGDTPHVTSPFSIHRIVKLSQHTPGEWFGPHSICCALKKALSDCRDLHPKLQSIEMYFAADRTIYTKEVFELIQDRTSSDDLDFKISKPKGLIIMIPVQLGNDQYFNPVYSSVLCRWLKDPCCLGVIGGKPRHSIYIVGYQDKNVIYLDPHFLQETVNVGNDSFSPESYHCMSPLLLPFANLDPSCAVGFYCQDSDQLNQLLNRLQEMSTVYMRNPRNPSQLSPRPVIEVIKGYHKPLMTLLTPANKVSSNSFSPSSSISGSSSSNNSGTCLVTDLPTESLEII